MNNHDRAKMFREAADRIWRGANVWSCLAILAAGGTTKDASGYDEMFHPDYNGYYTGSAWGIRWVRRLPSDDYGVTKFTSPTLKRCRTLALLFAAAMAEEGDLP